jgi:hypothetical protein
MKRTKQIRIERAGKMCRRHLYGDIYSSPGLSLAQKQILMVAFLGEANMHEQLFGHLLAVCTPLHSPQQVL